MAMASTTMATVTAVVKGVTAAVSVFSAIRQGQQAQANANFQAQVANQQAQREQQVAAAQEEDFRRDQKRLMAIRRANLGASGVEAGSGSPLMVSEDMAGEVELQARRIRQGGEVNATRLNQQADLFRRAGSSARTNSYMRAGSSLLKGIGGVYEAIG